MIIYLLLILAGLCKAVMDKADFHYGRTWLPRYFNPALNWTKKYKNVKQETYKLFGLARYLPFLYDGWHLANLIQIIAVCTAISMSVSEFSLLNIILYISAYLLTFTLFFDYILEDWFGIWISEKIKNNPALLFIALILLTIIISVVV